MTFLSREAKNDVKVQEGRTKLPERRRVWKWKWRWGGGGGELEGKRKGHVCETGAVWYFSCQPEERKSHTYTHKHKAISPPPPASFHLYGASVVLAARACTDTHTEIDA